MMMRNNNICYWVDQRHVKEVWIFGYGGADRNGWESNVSSTYGDFSNSDRDPADLPICAHSYTVYDYNYGRTSHEAVHNHMHQFEAIFSDIDFELFGVFTGWPPVTSNQIARCGNTHFSPNGETDYDWSNSRLQRTDCEDWRPVGYGTTKVVTCSRWNCDDLDYFKYWMQNVPGFGNRLSDCGARDAGCVPTRRMKNWWTFIYNFDLACRDPSFWRPVVENSGP